MNKTADSLKEIVGSVQLAGVRLSQLNASGSLPEGGVRGGAAEIAHSARVKNTSSDGFVITATITVRVAMKRGGKRTTGREVTLLSLQAGFDLIYVLPRAKRFSATDLARFANVNGVYNAWPYWRELVQNISVRMGLPGLTLPVFRIPRIDQGSQAVKRIARPKRSNESENNSSAD